MTVEQTIFKELPLSVEFDFQPYEPPETGPEARYPGCAASVEIDRVWFGKVDVTDQLTDDELQAIADELLALSQEAA